MLHKGLLVDVAFGHDRETPFELPDGLLLHETSDPALIAQVGRVRVGAWTPRVPMREDVWADEHDAHARHFVIRTGQGEVVAVERFCVHDHLEELPHPETLLPHAATLLPRYVYPSRLAVLPTLRGRGLARALHELCFSEAAKAGRTMVCYVEEDTPREVLMRALGFEPLKRGFEMFPWGPRGPCIQYAVCAMPSERLNLQAVQSGERRRSESNVA